MKKTIITSILIILSFISCQKDIELTLPAHQYFIDIAMRSEIRPQDLNIRKWTKDIKIHFEGLKYSEFNNEKQRVIDELNDLIDEISIDIVDERDEANVIGVFSIYEDYKENYEPIFCDFLPNATSVRGAGNVIPIKGEIQSATFFVNVGEISSGRFSSIYREELTQILGLPNDTDTYPESIFFNGEDSYVTEYADIDKEIIKILYSDAIKPNMNRCQVKKALSRLE